MPTGDAPSAPTEPVTVVTRLPPVATVLVVSSAPPAVPGEPCVDVRPGPFATFDGDRLQLALVVIADGERRRFGLRELPALAAAATAHLGDADAGDARPGRSRSRRHPTPVLRFGDRAAIRRRLPRPAADAVERRLAAAAGRAGATLVAWGSDPPTPGDDRAYDVVLGGRS